MKVMSKSKSGLLALALLSIAAELAKAQPHLYVGDFSRVMQRMKVQRVTRDGVASPWKHWSLSVDGRLSTCRQRPTTLYANSFISGKIQQI